MQNCQKQHPPERGPEGSQGAKARGDPSRRMASGGGMRNYHKEENIMAIRNVRVEGDPILRKKSREVREVTPKIRELIDDMLETMYEKEGVGLAAPQVGILKRVVVIDIGDGPLVMINPRVVREEGSQTGDEGCLSIPGKAGQVTRPNDVTVRYMDENEEYYELDGTELLARAICHECEHLDGKLYVDIVEGGLHDVVPEDEEE